MVDLAQIRSDIAQVLTDAGFKSIDYVAETIVPPVAVVVPDDPYITHNDETPFGHVAVNVTVVVIGGKGTNKAAASQIDDLIVQAYLALDEVYDVADVGPPGQVNLNGQTFLGAVLHLTETVKA